MAFADSDKGGDHVVLQDFVKSTTDKNFSDLEATIALNVKEGSPPGCLFGRSIVVPSSMDLFFVGKLFLEKFRHFPGFEEMKWDQKNGEWRAYFTVSGGRGMIVISLEKKEREL